MKRIFVNIFALIAIAVSLQAAQQPENYYKLAEGKKQQALLESLRSIVSANFQSVSYDGLWNAYLTTDVENGYYLDMYSNVMFKPGEKENKSYSKIGDSINREHSFPQSWFNELSPMKSDLFHVYPTDGYVNNQRSNYPFAECENGTRLTYGSYYGKGKKGTCTTPGFSGTVWEPDDEYKGDFARTYFYMATRYNSEIAGWSGNGTASEVLAGNSYPVYQDWYITMLLRWHELDPVSEKERKRNDAVYDIQGNRNPYIDHPELALHIWGDKQNEEWNEGETGTDPEITLPAKGSEINLGSACVDSVLTALVQVKARNITSDLTVAVAGEGFSCATTTIGLAEALEGTTIEVTYTSPVHASAQGSITVACSEASSTATLRAVAEDQIVAGEATAVTTTSFCANWSGGTNVDSYTLTVAGKGFVPPGEYKLLLEENFASPTWSTEGKTYQESGYLRLGTGKGPGAVVSPALDFTSLGGVATVYVECKPYGSDADVPMKVSLIDASSSTLLDSETLTLESTEKGYYVVLQGAKTGTAKIRIESLETGKRVMLKSAQVYAGNAAENAASAPRWTATEQGDSLSRTITGITSTHYVVADLAQKGSFKYYVTAVYADGTAPVHSNVVEVKLAENLLGDVSGDGVVNVGDVTELINIILNSIENPQADVNGDGLVNVSDVTHLINIILTND